MTENTPLASERKTLQSIDYFTTEFEIILPENHPGHVAQTQLASVQHHQQIRYHVKLFMPVIPTSLVDEEPSLWNQPLSSPLLKLALPKSDHPLPGSEL